MTTRLAVKAITRAHLLEGPLTFKGIATEAVPERRLRKAADDADAKDLRVWELRDVLPGALRADATATLDLLSDLLGLRSAGVVIEERPLSTPADVGSRMLRKDLASRFVERLAANVAYNINVMDASGTIIASTDPARVDTFHESAYRVVTERLGIMADGKKMERRGGIAAPCCLTDDRRIAKVAALNRWSPSWPAIKRAFPSRRATTNSASCAT